MSACAPAKLLRCQGGPAPGTLLVEGFYKVDIRFAQLDADALVTSVNHFLRELKPDKAEAFAVRRDAEEQGKVVLYRLRNIGTGDAYEFADVPVKRLGGEWKISDEGWDRIRAELESNIRVRLARPIL